MDIQIDAAKLAEMLTKRFAEKVAGLEMQLAMKDVAIEQLQERIAQLQERIAQLGKGDEN